MPTTAFQPFGERSSALRDEVARGVVDEDVDPAEMPKDAFDHLVDLVRLPDVDLHRQRIEARVSQSRGALLEVLGVAAADDDACAELAETQGYRQPDTSSASRDDGDLVLKRRGCNHVSLSGVRIQNSGR